MGAREFWTKRVVLLSQWIFPILLSCGILCWVLKLWRADLQVPFAYSADSICIQAWTKNILDEGWYLHNPYLSFPSRMDVEDYPLPDNLHFLALKLLGLLSS